MGSAALQTIAIFSTLLLENISNTQTPFPISDFNFELPDVDSIQVNANLVTVEDCVNRIGTPSNRTITVFTAGSVTSSALDSYTEYLLEKDPSLSQTDIATWNAIFGEIWLHNATSLIPEAQSWIPEARSYHALASRAINNIHVLIPHRRRHTNPWQDGRETPWTSYVFPTLSRSPSVTSITVIDPLDFSRRRVRWRQHDARFRRPVNLGTHFLSPNTTNPDLLPTIIEKGDPVPITPYPTVFWSSLCEDTEVCLDQTSVLVDHFIATHLNSQGVHWFNLSSYLGANPIDMEQEGLASYLSIGPDSPCFDDVGPTAVLEAEMAQGTAYVILKKGADLARASQGVKKLCWWCECELSVLTRNIRVSQIVRVDAETFKMEVVWEKGMAPIGRDPRALD